MPTESVAPQTQCATNIQNALELFQTTRLIAVIGREFVILQRALEEAGRRQLLLVPRDDELSATINRTDGIVGPNLRCLIEDDQIELKVRRLQEGTDSQGTHHETRLQSRQQSWDGPE